MQHVLHLHSNDNSINSLCQPSFDYLIDYTLKINDICDPFVILCKFIACAANSIASAGDRQSLLIYISRLKPDDQGQT